MNNDSPIGPDPHAVYPLGDAVKRLVFLKNVVSNPNIEVGDYTYYDDPDGAEAFERNVLYHFDFRRDKLRIGKFCAIAAGAKFMMNGANHRTEGFSSYPFAVFSSGWSEKVAGEMDFPNKGDTVVENDVWLGYDALVLPGIRIGNGAIVASRAVVAADVPDYAIVAGNPAKIVRMRFEPPVVRELLDIAWWDWDAEKITRNIPAICGADMAALRSASRSK